jgi:hypothetical protein
MLIRLIEFEVARLSVLDVTLVGCIDIQMPPATAVGAHRTYEATDCQKASEAINHYIMD